ncbi:hydrophobin [Trichoderma virens Gv29-8]
MYASVIFYTLVALTGIMASPVQEPEAEGHAFKRSLEPRLPTFADIPFPKFPARNPHHDPKGNNNKGKGGKDSCPSGGSSSQANACSSGSPYCCSSNGKGGHECSNTTACDTTIICCNNNNGFQICIGDIDFNVPITINIYE